MTSPSPRRRRGGPPAGASVGLDVAEVERFRAQLGRLLSGRGALARVFTAAEHRACRRYADPAPHYAARWCAKEAAVKALSRWARLRVHDVEIRGGGRTPPAVVLRRRAADLATADLRVSLTHTRTIAAAVVVAFVAATGR